MNQLTITNKRTWNAFLHVNLLNTILRYMTSKCHSMFRNHFVSHRLFPLSLVKISVHNLEKKQLRLKLVTGCTYYLQLYPPPHQQLDLFNGWIKLAQILRPSSEINFKQQKLENKKLKNPGAPLVPPLKPKVRPSSVILILKSWEWSGSTTKRKESFISLTGNEWTPYLQIYI